MSSDVRAAGPAIRETRAVLVDDHQLVLEGLGNALRRQGMTVVGSFLDRETSVDFLAETTVDFLVVDLRLGDNSGITVVGEARRLQPMLKIAVLTSFDDVGAAAESVRAGATGYLLKDRPSEELGAQFRAVAEGHLVLDSRVASAVLKPAQLLGEQELVVLDLVAQGLTNKEIGSRLHLSHYTIKDYLSKAMRKLGTSTRAETVITAVQRGLLHPASGAGQLGGRGANAFGR